MVRALDLHADNPGLIPDLTAVLNSNELARLDHVQLATSLLEVRHLNSIFCIDHRCVPFQTHQRA